MSTPSRAKLLEIIQACVLHHDPYVIHAALRLLKLPSEVTVHERQVSKNEISLRHYEVDAERLLKLSSPITITGRKVEPNSLKEHQLRVENERVMKNRPPMIRDAAGGDDD